MAELAKKESAEKTVKIKKTANGGGVDKLIEFFKNYYGFFLIPISVFVLFGIALHYYGIWPFGKAIIASYDMLAQVCPILEHFFDVFQGESDIFHTFHLGGGMDMFGILAYCAVSPFTLMFLFAGEGGSIYMVSIVLPLKFACIGISALIFLRRYFKSLPSYLHVVLALLYAFSGYSYVANTYIIWMDLMIWMPLLGAGFIEFARTKKIRWLVLGIAVNIYTCFSIVCFSLLILFPIFICYILICKNKFEWREYISKLCLAFVVAVAIALPILLPSLMAYTKAGRNTGLFSRVFEILSESKLQKGELGLPIYEKFSYILCDSTFIVLAVVYFYRSKKGDKLSLFLLVAFIYLILPCLVDESMLLLNMGSYYSYALRFGFLNSFFMFFISAKCLEEVLQGVKDEEVGNLKNNISSIIMMVLTLAGALFTMLFYRYIANGDYENDPIIKWLYGSNSEVEPFKDFFALFAHSEGGLEGTVLLFLVVAIIFTVAILLIKFKCLKFKEVVSFLCILSLSQPIFFTFTMVKGNRLTQSGPKFDYYAEMIDKIDETETDLYRLKSYDYYLSSDSPMILGSYAHTLFSSMADAKNLTAPKFFEYRGSGTNSTRPNGGNKFSDALLGYKYMIVEASDFTASGVVNSQYKETDIATHKTPSIKISTTTYTKKVNGTDSSVKVNTWKNVDIETHGKDQWTALKIVIENKKFKGYMGDDLIYSINLGDSIITGVNVATKYTFGSARNLVLYDKSGNQIDGEWKLSSGWTEENGVYTTENQTNKLHFSGDVTNLKEFRGEVLFTRGNGSDDHIGLEITVKKSETEIKTHRIVIEPNVAYKVYVNEYAFPMAAVIKSGELIFKDGESKGESYRKLTELLNDGEPTDINSTNVSKDKIIALYNKLKKTEVKFTLEKSAFKFEPIVAEKGQMLYLNYVNLDGYKAYVNGKERPLKENSLDFIFVELDEGENIVEIKYKSPYKSFILIGIVLSALILVACWFIYKKKPVVFEKLSIILPYMGVALGIGLTVFFFIYPTGIFAKKIFVDYWKFLF